MGNPVELWGLAVELAERHEGSRSSQTLLVGFYSLQERVAACGRSSEETGITPAVIAISFLVAAQPRHPLGCVAPFRAGGDLI
jgi:hypothetical protein